MIHFAIGEPHNRPRLIWTGTFDQAEAQALSSEIVVGVPGPGEYVLTQFGYAPFVPELAEAKTRLWNEVKAARARHEEGGCATSLGRVDTDADSQRKVSGSVQMAMIAHAAGAPFEIMWTMQDNSEVPHDAAAMIAMGLAVGGHVSACHAAARSLWTAIDAAADLAAVDAIDINQGWPS